MIVNHYSVLMLFMSALGLALAGVLAATALAAARRIRRSRDQQQTSEAERSVHLATLVAIVCLTILVVGWPLLYAMLGSFVPEIPGAMCVYGVTKVMPITTTVIQAAKPAVVFVLGAWLLLEYVRRRSGLPPRRSRGMFALAAVAVMMAAAHGAELYYVLNMESLNEVSCCSSYGQSAAAKLQAPSYYLPWALPERARSITLTALFFAGIPLLALWLLVRAPQRMARPKWSTPVQNAALLAASAGLGLACWWAIAEVFAPRLMRLPFHHCLYCLVMGGRVPDAPLMVANLAVGLFCAGWAAVLGTTLQSRALAPAASRLHRRVCMLGATTLAASVLMVVMHLAVT